MRHVKIGEERRGIALLAVFQAEAEKRHLVAVAFPRRGHEMPRVVPPLGFEVGVRVVVARERYLPSRQRRLIRERRRKTQDNREDRGQPSAPIDPLKTRAYKPSHGKEKVHPDRKNTRLNSS